MNKLWNQVCAIYVLSALVAYFLWTYYRNKDRVVAEMET